MIVKIPVTALTGLISQHFVDISNLLPSLERRPPTLLGPESPDSLPCTRRLPGLCRGGVWW